VLSFAGTILVAAPTQAASADEQWFIDQINNHRQSRGIAPLAIDGQLASSAAGWNQAMASSGSLSHDPNLTSAVCCWTKIGENVGRGSNRDMIWAAFLSSAQHRGNIEDPAFTHLGVAVLVDGSGQMWTVHRFMRSGGGGSSAPPAPAPTPAPAPVIVIPRDPAPTPQSTTSAPTTTTPTTAPPPPPSDGDGDEMPPPPVKPERVAVVLDALHQL
jgi:hypothetical protein